ncbi:hypothetical protein [Pseudalkalibacillus caeni]|uniref:Uncharacterized protein n=1 Tax=Exobacillus caeni TaxID=2574798 RepID=A0A5R9F9T7_9BACL|nr:hypothetical protein [Pseudalkalibacillus caeni]TLS36465.1 hypothetical protein FCL54_14690 [Pseudalkalibacillus caeni]
MWCTVSVVLKMIGKYTGTSEFGTDEFIFYTEVNGKALRHPASGVFEDGDGIFTWILNRTIYSQVVEGDTVTINIKYRLIEDDPIYDDLEAISELTLTLPCSNFPISLEIDSDEVEGLDKVGFRTVFNIQIEPYTAPV